jgi:pimeloyl-ACP methyl ester carboxylesterase
VLEGPGHFIQEDAPDELVAILDDFIRTTSDRGAGSPG